MTDNLEKEIKDGARVEQLVDDPAVREAIGRLEKKYYDEFKAAKTADDLQAAKSKSVVLDDFLNELRAVVHNGAIAKAKIGRQPTKR